MYCGLNKVELIECSDSRISRIRAGYDIYLPSEYIYLNTLSSIAEVTFYSGDISVKKVFFATFAVHTGSSCVVGNPAATTPRFSRTTFKCIKEAGIHYCRVWHYSG
jgi:hypothetical protein